MFNCLEGVLDGCYVVAGVSQMVARVFNCLEGVLDHCYAVVGVFWVAVRWLLRCSIVVLKTIHSY